MKPAPPLLHRSSAFTLLELLIAIAIFAVVLAAINGVFYGALRLRNKSTHSLEEAVPLQQTLSILKRDLQGLVAPGGVLAGRLQSGTAAGNGGVIPQGATTLYTCTGVLDETLPWGDIQKVIYYLKPSDTDAHAAGKDLVRGVSRNLLPTAQEILVEQWLMSGVERLQFAYYDGAAWRDTWDSTTADATTGQTNNLPRAIKVQIELAVNQGEPRTKAPAQLVVPVIIQARTNRTATTSTGA